MHFDSSFRTQTAKTIKCAKKGVFENFRKSTKECLNPHFLHKKSAKNAVLCSYGALLRTLMFSLFGL